MGTRHFGRLKWMAATIIFKAFTCGLYSLKG